MVHIALHSNSIYGLHQILRYVVDDLLTRKYPDVLQGNS